MNIKKEIIHSSMTAKKWKNTVIKIWPNSAAFTRCDIAVVNTDFDKQVLNKKKLKMQFV